MALKRATHIVDLQSNVAEVDRLMTIHQHIAGTDRGRKFDVEVLNKSGIVLLVACWEAFVEDLAVTSLEFMVNESADHRKLPRDLLELVGNKNQGLKAWSLAGNGWSMRLFASEVLPALKQFNPAAASVG